MLVHAQHPDVVGEHGLHRGEAGGAEVAVARVVAAALGVVEVGHDRRADPGGRAEHVEPVGPGQVGAGLVDLVDRDRVRADGAGRGRADHQGAAAADHVLHGGGHAGALPLPQRVRGAAGAGEDPAGSTEPREGPLHVGRGGVGPAPGRGLDGVADTLHEVLQRLGDQVVGVVLEAEGGVQGQRGAGCGRSAGRGVAEGGGQDGAVGADHGGGGLARPHDDETAHECSGGWVWVVDGDDSEFDSGPSLGIPSTSIRSAANRSGCCRCRSWWAPS